MCSLLWNWLASSSLRCRRRWWRCWTSASSSWPVRTASSSPDWSSSTKSSTWPSSYPHQRSNTGNRASNNLSNSHRVPCGRKWSTRKNGTCPVTVTKSPITAVWSSWSADCSVRRSTRERRWVWSWTRSRCTGGWSARGSAARPASALASAVIIVCRFSVPDCSCFWPSRIIREPSLWRRSDMLFFTFKNLFSKTVKSC